MTYNGLIVRNTIETCRILSAFANEIDPEKIENYYEEFKYKMLSHDFPAIIGFPSIISKDDVGTEKLNGDIITEDDVGKYFWYVTDGHHRSIAAINAGIPFLETELDYSCITDPNELYQ